MENEDVKTKYQTTILHASDLHFGQRFNKPLWENFKSIAETTIKPDLIIITGDLVNSPWRWALAKVGRELDGLLTSVRNSNPQCTLMLVPGNHDTRLSGLVPVRWVRLFALGFCALALFAWFYDYTLWLTGILSFLGVAALGLGMSLSTNLEKYWGKKLVKKIQFLPDLKLQILPFDSASKGLSGARGQIDLRNLIAVADDLLKGNGYSDVFRIAVLHHHPLPLPYDNSSEPLMVLDNAGAFLYEMSKHKVSLVLHGHKHHHHFSRLVIDPKTKGEVELAVLSTGTPTQGLDPDRFGFNFNTIKVNYDGTASVIPYQASGGAFTVGEPFSVEHKDHHAQQKFSILKEKAGRSCKSLVAMVSINADGDAYFRREYRKLSINGNPISELPDVLRFQSHGHVEQFEAYSLGNGGVGVRLELTKHEVECQEGCIKFSHDLSKEDDPIDFAVHCHGHNAFAMNSTQCQLMYDASRSDMEFVQIRVPKTPVESIALVVRLPGDFELGEQVFLETSVDDKSWKKATVSAWYAIHSPATIVVNIQLPVPGTLYKVSWQLPDDKKQKTWADRLESRLDEIAESLCKINPQIQHPKLQVLLTMLENETRKELELDLNEQLELCISPYNSATNQLETRLANYHTSDSRWGWCFKYGNGVAGRAFKTGRPTVFLRQAMSTKAGPYFYLRGDGRPAVSEDDVPEGVLLAIPLGHSDVTKRHYGVLSISSPRNSSKLSDTVYNEILISRFSQVINKACFDVFDKLC